jgi:hypothetical protein
MCGELGVGVSPGVVRARKELLQCLRAGVGQRHGGSREGKESGWVGGGGERDKGQGRVLN